MHAVIYIGKSVLLALSRNKNDVVSFRQTFRIATDRGLQLPAYAVTSNSLAVFFVYGKAYLCGLAVGNAVEHNKVSVRNAQRVLVHIVVLMLFFKSVNRLQNIFLLCAEAVTSLISASCKRSASASGLHSCAKTVHFASLSFLGLISSFHFSFSLCQRLGANFATMFRRELSILNHDSMLLYYIN